MIWSCQCWSGKWGRQLLEMWFCLDIKTNFSFSKYFRKLKHIIDEPIGQNYWNDFAHNNSKDLSVLHASKEPNGTGIFMFSDYFCLSLYRGWNPINNREHCSDRIKYFLAKILSIASFILFADKLLCSVMMVGSSRIKVNRRRYDDHDVFNKTE